MNTESTIYGYARVSTLDQDNGIQEEALKRAGASLIRSEKVSGTSRQGRIELETLLQFIRKGDTLLITRIDRLARSMKDLQDIVHVLRERGAHLKATEQPIDTSTAAGKAFLDMLGVFAEFETNLRRERQLEGVEKAKQAGKYKGRKATAMAKTNEVLALVAQGMSKAAVARQLSIGEASIYRIIKKAKS